MPTLKTILWTVAGGVAVSFVGAIVGFLSAARLEISFDKLKDFDITNLKSYAALGTSVKFELQLSEPHDFVAYWGDYENGKTVVQQSDVHFRNFKLSSSVEGNIIDHPKAGDVVYNIVGFYNSDRVVFSHRGPISGVGIYILNSYQFQNVPGQVFAGYAIFEDVKVEGKNETWLTQCPFVMVEQSSAAKPFPTLEDAQKAFSLLRTDCTEFKMPESS
jgi:hypothetical protein